MTVSPDRSKVIARRIGEEICCFANGECDCRDRARLCERVEIHAALILRLAASLNSTAKEA